MDDNLKQLAELNDENIELKKEIERLKAESGWVSVKDRLPEIGQWIDIWESETDSYRSHRVTNVIYKRSRKNTFSYWMPLPKNP